VGALYQPKNRLPIIKLVGWKSHRRLPPMPRRSIAPITCQNERCLHTEKRIICRPPYSYNYGELLLVGNAGRRCAFPAYMFGYRWWFGVWCLVGGALYLSENRLPIIKLVGWKSHRRLPPLPRLSISPRSCQNERCLHTEKRIVFRPTHSYICGEL